MFRMTSTIAFFATSSAVTAATLHVPANYSTIQDAIDAASSGDEVVGGCFRSDGALDPPEQAIRPVESDEPKQPVELGLQKRHLLSRWGDFVSSVALE